MEKWLWGFLIGDREITEILREYFTSEIKLRGFFGSCLQEYFKIYKIALVDFKWRIKEIIRRKWENG
jgi:hypothetical protein